jgi:hypothetical protein
MDVVLDKQRSKTPWHSHLAAALPLAFEAPAAPLSPASEKAAATYKGGSYKAYMHKA